MNAHRKSIVKYYSLVGWWIMPYNYYFAVGKKTACLSSKEGKIGSMGTLKSSGRFIYFIFFNSLFPIGNIIKIFLTRFCSPENHRRRQHSLRWQIVFLLISISANYPKQMAIKPAAYSIFFVKTNKGKKINSSKPRAYYFALNSISSSIDNYINTFH